MLFPHLDKVWEITRNISYNITNPTKHYYEYEQCYALGFCPTLDNSQFTNKNKQLRSGGVSAHIRLVLYMEIRHHHG